MSTTLIYAVDYAAMNKRSHPYAMLHRMDCPHKSDDPYVQWILVPPAVRSRWTECKDCLRKEYDESRA